ncbi:MAG TPA: class I SAM-dependent methyltransferase [Rhodospirillales bacterium]|nr:class I SAM-dependent methyltransferase [Rhodospirillales bacterium]
MVNGVDHIIDAVVLFGESEYRIENAILKFGSHGNKSLYDKMWRGDFKKQQKGEISYGVSRREKLLNRLGNKTFGWLEGKRFIDIGCGLGRFTHAAVELGADVISLDSSDVGLISVFDRLADKLTSKEFGRCDFVQANIMQSIFKDSQFDIVFSSYVLHHTEHTKKAIEIIAKYVNANGTLAVSIFNDSQGRLSMMRLLREEIMTLPEETLFRALAKGGLIEMEGVEKIIDLPKIVKKCQEDPDLAAVAKNIELEHLIHRETLSTPYAWQQSNKEIRSWIEEFGFTVEYQKGETTVGCKGKCDKHSAAGPLGKLMGLLRG